MAEAKLTAICVSVVVHNILSSSDSLRVHGPDKELRGKLKKKKNSQRKEVLLDVI